MITSGSYFLEILINGIALEAGSFKLKLLPSSSSSNSAIPTHTFISMGDTKVFKKL